MFRTLYSKLSIVLFLLICLIALLFLQLVRYSSEMYQQEVSQKLNRKLAAGIVKEGLLLKEGQINRPALKNIFHMLMVINPSIEVYLLDKQGRILAFSAPPGKVKRQRIDLAPLHRFLGQSANYPLLGDDPRNPQGHKVFSVAPVTRHGITEGYLYVILGGEAFDSITAMIKDSYIMRNSLWGIAASLLAALLAGILLFAMMTRRLRRLARLMSGYQPGTKGASHYDRSGSGDEIDQLGASFNSLSALIEEQIGQLRQTDELRRELIANVSHDLRTPLASLHGYLETLLLKSDSLSDQDRQRYLEIALAHSNRLGHLINELFELAKLDACNELPNSEAFTLGDLVQDVTQKFQLQADNKAIYIQLCCDPQLPLACGDVGMMQRVLENLLENAIRHTPAGGSIRIMLGHRQGEITVRIHDTGCGIPPQELTHIFERFFRLPKNRQDKGAHAGLGLAIAKRIVELHGGRIDVDSTVGHGTTFSFYLPALAL